MFTEEDISRIKLLLGYIEFPNLEPDIETRLQTMADPFRYQKTMNLVYEIENLSTQISEFIPKTFIQNVEGISLNYQSVVNNLKQEASRKLKELAFVTNLQVRYNPFTSGSKKFSIDNIW